MASAEAKEQESSPIPQVDLTGVGLGLAAITIVAAIAVGFFAGVGMALLTILTGALLGAILLVWHSLRTLAGDAEVDPDLELATVHVPTDLSEKKRRALRALKDLEQEHALGKIDDADYATLDADYREQAKELIREMDDSLAPFRERAEVLVREHLEKHPVVVKEPAREEEDDDADEEEESGVRECPKCDTANDPDAAFCKKCGGKLG
jgi:Ran GTPase-activating protein (RanGAP) involved in mRNA processing and transport